MRDNEFEKQIDERLELAEKEKANAVELAKSEVSSQLQKTAAEKDAEIQNLKAKLDAGEVALKLAISEAVNDVEKERDALKQQLERNQAESAAASKLAAAERSRELQAAAATKDAVVAWRTSVMVSSPSARCSAPVNSKSTTGPSTVTKRYRAGFRAVKICILRAPLA